MKHPHDVIAQTQEFVVLYPRQILILKMVAWQEIMLRGEKYFCLYFFSYGVDGIRKILSRNKFLEEQFGCLIKK